MVEHVTLENRSVVQGATEVEMSYWESHNVPLPRLWFW